MTVSEPIIKNKSPFGASGSSSLMSLAPVSHMSSEQLPVLGAAILSRPLIHSITRDSTSTRIKDFQGSIVLQSTEQAGLTGQYSICSPAVLQAKPASVALSLEAIIPDATEHLKQVARYGLYDSFVDRCLDFIDREAVTTFLSQVYAASGAMSLVVPAMTLNGEPYVNQVLGKLLERGGLDVADLFPRGARLYLDDLATCAHKNSNYVAFSRAQMQLNLWKSIRSSEFTVAVVSNASQALAAYTNNTKQILLVPSGSFGTIQNLVFTNFFSNLSQASFDGKVQPELSLEAVLRTVPNSSPLQGVARVQASDKNKYERLTLVSSLGLVDLTCLSE